MAVMIGVFWDSIGIVLAPKWVLRNAIMATLEQMQSRFSHHPLKIIMEELNENGRLSADLSFSVEDSGSNTMNGNIRLNVDIPNNQLYGEGSLGLKDEELDLMLYLDSSKMVMKRDRTSNGIAYGIRYDRFSEDIRKIPLLSVLIDDSVFDTWEKKILQVQSTVDFDFSVPQLPNISDDKINKLLWGVLLLPCSVEKLPCQDNKGRSCYQLCYKITPERLGMASDGAESTWAVSFTLCENELIQVDIFAQNGPLKTTVRFTCSENASVGPMRLQMLSEGQGTRREGALFATAKVGEKHISETWILYDDFDCMEKKGSFAYTWYPETGDLEFRSPPSDPITMVFRTDRNGIYLESKDWGAILSQFRKEWCNKLVGKTVQAAVTVRNGEPLKIPECKYLDSWSMEELLQILADIKLFLCAM